MLDQFAHAVFESLRRMDAEAEVLRDGNPTGLSWYAGFSRPELKRPRTEPEWSLRLAILLSECGFPSHAERTYPTSRKKCDLVIEVPELGRLWLEVKGAWKQWWVDRGNEFTYRSYLFHPLLPGLDSSKKHTAAFDLKKLDAVSRDNGSHVGLLLVGFDGDAEIGPDIDAFRRLAELDANVWSEFSDWWPDEHRSGEFVRCWLWIREI